MNKFYKLFYLYFLLIVGTAYSQSDSVLAYMPLQIGNQWQYKVHYVVTGPSNIDTTYYSFSFVERDTIMSNGYQYQVIKNSSLYQDYTYINIDSVTACVYEYDNDSSRGLKTDSLRCSEGDWFGTGSYCMLIDTANVLNYRTWIMGIDRSRPDITVTHTLAMDIGLVYHIKAETEGTWWETTTRTLVYANINGDEFGELVGFKNNINSEITGYKLSQNYPNPFNPTTTIRFTIPNSPLNPSPYQGEGNRERLVTLKVYDVLGNKVATLVNEEKPAGSYEVEFSVHSHSGTVRNLPSGVYFYRLRTNDFVETKKMLLLK